MTMVPMPGERGKQGDHGQAGDQGLKGETGLTGQTGETGHRGNRGNTGETGLTGKIGETGYRGQTGDRGDQGVQGERGHTGIRGRGLNWVQALVMFLFVVAAFSIAVNRTQVNAANFQNGIEKQRADFEQKINEQRYQSCLSGQKLLTQFDKFVDGMAAVELKGTNPNSPTYDKVATPTRLERAALYKGAKIVIPDCKKP